MKESFGPLWIIPVSIIIIALVRYAFDHMKYARKLKDKNESLYKPHRSYENN